MSSLTMPIRILRRPASPPVELDADREVPATPLCRDFRQEFGSVSLGFP